MATSGRNELKKCSWYIESSPHTDKKNVDGVLRKKINIIVLKMHHINIHLENADDTTVVYQVDYAENYTLQDQDQIQSAHWSKKQLSISTAYTWMGDSGEDGYSFGFVSNSKKHDKFTVITCLEILVQERTALMPDVDQIIFFRMVLPVSARIVISFNI
ncbi:unnamed protein product [Rotaria magnacalcarata]